MPGPVADAYVGALEVPCSSCGAEVGQYCTTPDGRLRRCPCVTRCASIPAELRSSALDSESGAAGTRSAPRTEPLQLGYPDITEPRHQRSDL